MSSKRNKIIDLYNVEGRDWMLYRVTRKNFLTIHHICERENGGKSIIDNLAPLTRKAHRNLNYMRLSHPDLYEEHQELFREIAITEAPPTEEHIERMRMLKIKARECGYSEN